MVLYAQQMAGRVAVESGKTHNQIMIATAILRAQIAPIKVVFDAQLHHVAERDDGGLGGQQMAFNDVCSDINVNSCIVLDATETPEVLSHWSSLVKNVQFVLRNASHSKQTMNGACTKYVCTLGEGEGVSQV